MRIGTDRAYVDLQILEVLTDPQAAGDTRVEATVDVEGFRGTYSQVWFGSSGLTVFVQNLRALLSDCEGTARLQAMSPQEFSLEISRKGAHQWVKVDVHLERVVHGGDGMGRASVHGWFELDPSLLPAVLSEFEALTT